MSAGDAARRHDGAETVMNPSDIDPADKLAEQIRDEFAWRYARDPQFRKNYNSFLRSLGVPVMPDDETDTTTRH